MEDRREKPKLTAQKDKIRERYKGLSLDEIQIIPAIIQETLHDDTREKRVAVYARVSTDDPRQTSSYELQKNHYEDMVNNHPGWKLTNIYADEGISGTSLQHRDAFIQMIEDCRSGKIDLIVTKSVARFARNVLDCIGHVRQLAALTPPVGILFEAENIYTLDGKSEIGLTLLSAFAQEESHNKSEIMNASVEMRFRRGIFLTPPLLGFDQNQDGDLVINEDEAKTIRLIFFMYLCGYPCAKIAETLTRLERETKKGNQVWSAGTVLNVLQNERHCGAVCARKTWTPNYLDHKSRKNRHNRNQYRMENHHDCIISRDDFIAVQRLISNAKYGNNGILPELQVITGGSLRGFVSVNPRWAGFKENDYRLVSASVDQAEDAGTEVLPEVCAKSGAFDLRGYQVARAQFFDTASKTSALFSVKELSFSSDCVRKFTKVQYVELLLHPEKSLLAVRSSTKENPRALHWAKQENDVMLSRKISGCAFLPTVYSLFGWNPDYNYRVRGIRYAKEQETVILFDMKETEVFIRNNPTKEDQSATTEPPSGASISSSGSKRRILAYPTEWAEEFGTGFYRQEQSRDAALFKAHDDWKTDRAATPFRDGTELQVSDPVQLRETVEELMNTLRQEVACEQPTAD